MLELYFLIGLILGAYSVVCDRNSNTLTFLLIVALWPLVVVVAVYRAAGTR